MMDLWSRNCSFYKKIDKAMEFSVSCLSTHKVSLQVLQDLLQVRKVCLPSEAQEVLHVLQCTLKHLRSDSHCICVEDLPQGMQISDFYIRKRNFYILLGKLVRDLNFVGPKRLSISYNLRIKRSDIRDILECNVAQCC